MASYQKSTVCCPILLLLMAFGALALLTPIPAYAQDLDSQLMEAAKKGQTERVKSLLDAGAKVNAKTGSGLTALMSAADSGHADTVQVLLSKGDTETVKALLWPGYFCCR